MTTMPARERLLVFIPAYRCEAQIPRVLAQFDARAQALVEEVIVVDNGSPDGSVATASAGLAGLTIPGRVIRNLDNYNLGGSHKVAFDYAITHGFDHVVVLHGDDQADFRDFVPAIERGDHRQVDAMLGSRFARGARLQGYSPLRTLGNHVFNGLFSLAAGRAVSDLGSGLNLYRVAKLKSGFFHRFPDALTFNYFMILAHAAEHWRLRFEPISWREEDQVSNVKLVSQTQRMLALLALYIFRRRAFLEGEHREVPRDAYRGEVVFENAAAQARGSAGPS